MHQQEKHAGRRAFLKRGLRIVMLGAVALVCGLLGRRKRRAGAGNSLCRVDMPCRHCPDLDRCSNSRAVESKNR
jgi:hypothetical protein